MVKWRSMLVAGWLWPFTAACGGVAAIAAGHSLRGDGAFLVLFALALLGAPAVVVTVAGWLPGAWSVELRQVVGLVLAVPVVMAKVVVASWALAAGANAAGPGWIE